MDKYKENVLKDVAAELGDYNAETLMDALGSDRDMSELMDELKNSDAVSGALSGSYFCNSSKAEAFVNASGIIWDDELRAYLEDCGGSLGDLIDQGVEMFDVVARQLAFELFIDDEKMREMVGDELEARKEVKK